MLRFLKSFFGKTTPPEPEVPYKVETPIVIDTYQPVDSMVIAPAPEPVKCGCGRSASGFCVGLHKLSQEEWAAHPDNPAKPVAESAPAKKPAAKKTAAKKSTAKKPAAITASKKPRAKKEPK